MLSWPFYLLAGAGVLYLLKRRTRRNPSARQFTTAEAYAIGRQIGINWAAVPFPVREFREGLSVELEHGLIDAETNVTDDDLIATGKIAWAHLKELPDYYTRLARMERGF